MLTEFIKMSYLGKFSSENNAFQSTRFIPIVEINDNKNDSKYKKQAITAHKRHDIHNVVL